MICYKIITFVTNHSNIKEKRLRELLSETEFLTKDIGSVLVGEETVKEGLINEVGGIKEALGKDEEEMDASMTVKSMLILAIATSIDALAVGVSFAFMQVQIVRAVSFIGAVTFALSAVGVKVGSIFGMKYKSKAEFFGGAVLIIIGLKILLEGLGIIG